jgi:hypothetical protein
LAALNIRAYTATSAPGPHPEVTVECDRGFVVIGGGARVNADEPGNLLTMIMPVDKHKWRAKAKDHNRPSPGATLTASCIAAEVSPENVFVAEATNVGARGRVSAHATLPSEYALVGGGARTWWEHPPWPGSLLTASFGSSDTWTAEAKDHVTPSPVVVTAFAIGLSRALMARISVQVISASDTSHLLQHRPSATADLTVGFAAAPGAVGVMTGGGARSDSQGPGSLLITSDPKDKTKWIAASKDHEVPDPTTIESFAFGLVAV